jgi:YggT family protein
MFYVYLRTFVDILFQILIMAIVARALLSWFPIGPGNPFYPLLVILHQITEPILAPMRRIVPMIGMLDISPMVAMLLLLFLRGVIDSALAGAMRSF